LEEVQMTFGKATVAVVALVIAFALGIWAGPSLTERAVVTKGRVAAAVTERSREATARDSEAVRRDARTGGEARNVRETRAATLAASAPEVQKHLKPLLNRGANMEIASDGFRDAEQFATVAHAARNTNVPFMALKHRILEEGKSLAAALKELKPEIDAAAEARRAREEARRDVAAMRG
jgi:hypothetical protein